MAGWGSKIIDTLSADLKRAFPDLKGLSVRNLKYMRAFAEAYPAFGELDHSPLVSVHPTTGDRAGSIVQTLSAQLSWSHHIALLDKAKDPDIRYFYLQKTAENGWSLNVMLHQIESRLHERQGAALTNFDQTLPPAQSDLARETLKSPYIFDFIAMQEAMQERDLESALLEHLKKFMLELGKGFAYVGNQYQLTVGDKEWYPDLLFYNYRLHCFVVVELKMGEFQPEYTGKLNFYTSAIDEQLKGPEDQSTIGVLLCKSANETIVRYALRGIETPLGISEYQLAEALPKGFKSELPSIEELEDELDKEYDSLKSPAQKKFDALKERIAALQTDEVRMFASPELIEEAYHESIEPLIILLCERLKGLAAMFLHTQMSWSGSSKSHESFVPPSVEWLSENNWFAIGEHRVYIYFAGFKKGSTESFDMTLAFTWVAEKAWHGFRLEDQRPQQLFGKKLYHEQFKRPEQEMICDTVIEFLVERLDQYISRLEESEK
jgi:predicted nuclease of restriction endonuclease-like (RecB) superfamily